MHHTHPLTLPLRFALGLLAWAGPVALAAQGPFSPPAGEPGSTAIPADSPLFIAWAADYQDYLIGLEATNTAFQDPTQALGPAEGTSTNIVNLGRGGPIVLLFDDPIFDGPGFDFAVFENSFDDTFLELAYVEVSSNGTDFFRFPNVSLTPGPVSAFGGVDSTNIDGLAGSFIQGFGTPFDLASLDSDPLLDPNAISFVRIVDIVGDGSNLDSNGNPIYDPFPTGGTAGFDLDAVGALHVVPEPGTLALLGLGAVALIIIVRRRR